MKNSLDGFRPGSHLISCSKFKNTSALKKSWILIPSPSQSFLIVEMVILLLRLLMILLTVDWVTPLSMHRALMEMPFSWQSSRILSRTASPILMILHLSLCKYVKKEYRIGLAIVTPFELK